MTDLILPFNPDEDRYQLIELELTNGKRVLALTAPFISTQKDTKQLMVNKFLVYPPKKIPRGAKKFFKPLFELFKGLVK